MKVVIDTNSLLSLVRYYLPFDDDGVLFDFFKSKIQEGEIIIIDKVYEQCRFHASGLILSKLEFLEDKSFLKTTEIPFKTDTLLSPSPTKFLRMMDNQFAVTVQKKRLSNVEFQNQKEKHLKDADIKQIILCQNLIEQGDEVVLVTEESARSNDNKLFKKIPAICQLLEISTMTLPELIKKYENLKLKFT